MDDLKDFKTEFAELLENTYISSNATNEEATEFWKKINALLLPNIPTKLYRFRTCNVDNIMSFQKQNKYFSSGNTYSTNNYMRCLCITRSRYAELIPPS